MTTIEQILKRLKVSQTELSRRLKISRSAVSQALHGGIKKRSTAERYAAALGCDWKDLLD